MLYRADVWLVLNNAFDDLVIVYTVFEAFVIVSVVVLKREVFAAIWMACLLGRARPRPFHGVDKCGYVSEGIICGFVMINLYISGQCGSDSRRRSSGCLRGYSGVTQGLLKCPQGQTDVTRFLAPHVTHLSLTSLSACCACVYGTRRETMN